MSSNTFAESLEHDQAGNDMYTQDNNEMDTDFMELYIDEYETKAFAKKAKAKAVKKERDQLRREENDMKYGLDLLIQED